MFCLSVNITSINSLLLISVCLMLGCSLMCLLFHVTIIIPLYFVLLLTMVLFYAEVSILTTVVCDNANRPFS